MAGGVDIVDTAADAPDAQRAPLLVLDQTERGRAAKRAKAGVAPS